MKRTFFLALALGIATGCTNKSDNPQVSGSVASSAPGASPESATEHQRSERFKEQGELTFYVNVLPAIEFIERSGDVIDPADREDLATEQVMLLECGLTDERKDFWEYKGLQMSREEAMNYLVGQVASDVMVQQDGKTADPTGVSYEGAVGAVNKIRVQLFFKGLNMNKPLKVLYNDRLTGTGLMKFDINQR